MFVRIARTGGLALRVARPLALGAPSVTAMKPLRLNNPAITNFTRSIQVDHAPLKVDPQLMIAFTCKKCDTRSSHTLSKQSYEKGSVLIQCPSCKNRHLIADNLKIFSDDNFNLEDVLKARGESVATDTNDLAFEDIPDSLKAKIGHHAKDAPVVEDSGEAKGLPDK